MNLKFSIIDVVNILKAFGEIEVSQSLENIVKKNPIQISPNDFKVVVRSILSYEDNSDDRTIVYDFIYDKLNTIDWFCERNDTIDFSLIPKDVSINDILYFCITDSYTADVKYKLFSDRFFDGVMATLNGLEHPMSKLFAMEIYMLQRKQFNRLYDRNLDCKETDEDLVVTYQPRGKDTILTEDKRKWAKGYRQSAKPIRVIRKIKTHFDYPDSFYEKLNNALVARYVMRGEFRLVDGQDIVRYYHEDSYDRSVSTGSLESSCMRHDSCSEYIELYTDNPSVVSMLVYFNNDDLVVGRALIWSVKETKYMDRVYGSDSMIIKFKKYAKENGIIWKQEQSYSNTMGWCEYIEETDSVTEFDREISVTLINKYKAPYMDTFKYLDNPYIELITLNNYGGDHELSGTDGNFDVFRDDEDTVYCDISGDSMGINDDDCVCIDGIYYHDRFTVYSERDDNTYLERDCVRVGDDWVLQDNTIYISYSESAYKGDCILRDDAVWLQYIGEDVHSDEAYYNELTGRHEFIHDKLIDVCIEYSDGHSKDFVIDREVLSVDYIQDQIIMDDVLKITIDGIIQYNGDEVLVND